MQWENIDPGKKHNFKKLPRTNAYPLYPYDFSSIMQYDFKTFGIDQRPTMVLAVEHEDLFYLCRLNNLIIHSLNKSTWTKRSLDGLQY